MVNMHLQMKVQGMTSHIVLVAFYARDIIRKCEFQISPVHSLRPCTKIFQRRFQRVNLVRWETISQLFFEPHHVGLDGQTQQCDVHGVSVHQPLATGEGGRGVRQTLDDSLGQLIKSPWWNNDEVNMNHSRTISDAKSWLTSASYRHVIRSSSGVIWMDLAMSNHFGHHFAKTFNQIASQTRPNKAKVLCE
jgi:hypothetical protein